MNIREVKREVESLPEIADQLTAFETSWIAQIRANTNKHLEFLTNLDKQTKNRINAKLTLLTKAKEAMRHSSHLKENLRLYAHHLIEIKLAQLRDDSLKQKSITNKLLKDEAFALSSTLAQTNELQHHVSHLEKTYHEINTLLAKELSLEEQVRFEDQGHKHHLGQIKATIKKKQTLLDQLGKEFIKLTKRK